MGKAESILCIESREPGEIGEPTSAVPAFENSDELDRLRDKRSLWRKRGASGQAI
jgi:hypothetical protein